MNTKNTSYLKGFLPLFVLLSLFACKKEQTNIGVNLRPDGGAINGTRVNIEDIISRSIPEDSVRTDSLNSAILGALNDPMFGESRAILNCQPILPEFGYDFSGVQFDSITLTLKFDRTQLVNGVEQLLVYGDLDDQLDIDVYRIDEDLVEGDRYYSNANLALGSQVGAFSGRMFFHDSVEVKTENDTFNVGPELHIRLDDAFGLDMISQASSVYSSQEDFLAYLKGLSLVPKLNLSSGDGVIVGIDLDLLGTVMSIHHDSSERKDFIFNGAERFQQYQFASQSASILAQHTGSGQFSSTYVQAMGASKVRVDIPGLDSIIEKGEEVAIAEAVLKVKVAPGTVDADHGLPPRLLLLQPDSITGGNVAIQDFVDDIAPPTIDWFGNTNYGGEYDSDLGGYIFHFNRHLQFLIKHYNETGENIFDGFYIVVPSDFPITPYRAVLDTDPSTDGIEVSVTYTKLN